MRAQEFITEDITPELLHQIEYFADSLWAELGIDIEFTRHFLERLNDERNGKPITARELARLLKKEYEQNGSKIAAVDGEAVMKDLLTDINLPFVMKDTDNTRELIAKTIMRKPGFKTHNREFPIK